MPTPSFTGALYFLTFIDDYMQYTIITFLKKKSDALSHFLVYKNLVEKSSWKSKSYKVIIEQNSIRKNSITYLHQTTITHHPQQNGKAKRKNRTLMDVARSMLKTANLPNTFWEEAVATACYLQNRLPTTTLSSQTPFKKWSGIKPDLSHVGVKA